MSHDASGPLKGQMSVVREIEREPDSVKGLEPLVISDVGALVLR